MGLLSPKLTTGTRQAWQRRQGFYRYLNVAALPSSLIPTPPDDEQSPGIFHLQEDLPRQRDDGQCRRPHQVRKHSLVLLGEASRWVRTAFKMIGGVL